MFPRSRFAAAGATAEELADLAHAYEHADGAARAAADRRWAAIDIAGLRAELELGRSPSIDEDQDSEGDSDIESVRRLLEGKPKPKRRTSKG